MPLAQLTATQIPYEWIDWVHLAIYFFALPIVAFLGASLGLLGRVRRGGILRSTHVGLLGGITTWAVLAAPIALGGTRLPPDFIAFVEDDYRWQLLFAALVATSGCAFASAIAWRCMNKPGEIKPFNISLFHVLIIQLFSFLSLGAWVGFRTVVLNAIDPTDYSDQLATETMNKWIALDWRFSNYKPHDTAVLNIIGMESADIQKSMTFLESKDLQLRLAKINGLSLVFDHDTDLDFQKIANNSQIKVLTLEYQRLRDANLKALAGSQIETLRLGGSLSVREFTAISQMPRLKSLTITGSWNQDALRYLSGSTSLRELLIYNNGVGNLSTGPMQWPSSLEILQIGDWPPLELNLDLLSNLPKLKSLDIATYSLKESQLSKLQSELTAKKLCIAIEHPTPSMWAVLASLPSANAQGGELNLTIDDADFTRQEAAHLKSMTNLKWLRLAYAEHNDDVLEELAQIPSLRRLDLGSSRITAQGFETIAMSPTLEWLQYPFQVRNVALQVDLRAKRVSKGLQPLQMQSTMVAPKPTATITGATK
jgi:hypothetical protein